MRKESVAKSKPVKNFIPRSRAGTSTVPSSTASSSPGIFGLEDHEVSFEAPTMRRVAQNAQKDITKSDTMEGSQVTHSDASSLTSAGGGPVA